MKRYFAFGAAVALSVATASASFAAGNGSSQANPMPAATPMPTVAAVAGATVTTGAVTGVTATTGVSTTLGYSATNPPPIVPRGATTYSTVGSTVTYQVGTTYYHVTYLAGGRYTYVINTSPAGTVSGVSSTTTAPTAVSGITSGTTVLPSTGGGSPSPAAPWLPFGVAIFLMASGLLARRLAKRSV